MSGCIDKNELIARLIRFSQTPSRNHIAFVSQCDDELRFVDIGLELSKKVEDILSDRRLSLKSQDYLNGILNKHLADADGIGSYLAIRNIGILFEPLLMIDVEALFNKWSQNTMLIVDLGKGDIFQERFFLVPHCDLRYSVDLHELNYMIMN